jgi:hypothetical protein
MEKFYDGNTWIMQKKSYVIRTNLLLPKSEYLPSYI